MAARLTKQRDAGHMHLDRICKTLFNYFTKVINLVALKRSASSRYR